MAWNSPKAINQFVCSETDRKSNNTSSKYKEYILVTYGNVNSDDTFCDVCHEADNGEIFELAPKTGKSKRQSSRLHPDNCTPCTFKGITTFEDLENCLTKCNCVEKHLKDIFSTRPPYSPQFVVRSLRELIYQKFHIADVKGDGEARFDSLKSCAFSSRVIELASACIEDIWVRKRSNHRCLWIQRACYEDEYRQDWQSDRIKKTLQNQSLPESVHYCQ